MNIQELHTLLRKEVSRMVESADINTSASSLPGSPLMSIGSLTLLNNEARHYTHLWARLAKVCSTKYGNDPANWPPNAVKACELLGAKAQQKAAPSTTPPSV